MSIPDSALTQAIASHKRGDGAAAEPLYRAVLAREPGNAEANHNLGVLLMQRGAPDLALPFLKAALDARPLLGPYWLSYARGLLKVGDARAAHALLMRGRAGGLSGQAFEILLAQATAAAGMAQPPSPSEAQQQVVLGTALATQGKLAEAIAAYRAAIAIDPDHAEAHFRLGSLLSETGAIAEGFSHYMRRAQLLRGGRAWREGGTEKPHKEKHDREQAAYLGGMPGVDVALFRLEDGERIDGPAVNPANATPELVQRWHQAQPQAVVIENFLTAPALEKLRRYCAGSTIWHRVYEAGYIGATPEDGLACPLMAQIAEEIRALYPQMIGDHVFRYLGAFKYDSEYSTGTNTHADNSAVNVNFYIAPDDANLDAQSGGMDIWNVAAPPGEEMRRYNGDEELARGYLRQSGASLTRIAHRANRAVIFRSDLFHKTSECRFREGYLNKRINVSLLFGHRAPQAPR